MTAAYSIDLRERALARKATGETSHLMRKSRPRDDVDATWRWRRVGQLIDLFSLSECANYLANSGYGSV